MINLLDTVERGTAAFWVFSFAGFAFEECFYVYVGNWAKGELEAGDLARSRDVGWVGSSGGNVRTWTSFALDWDIYMTWGKYIILSARAATFEKTYNNSHNLWSTKSPSSPSTPPPLSPPSPAPASPAPTPKSYTPNAYSCTHRPIHPIPPQSPSQLHLQIDSLPLPAVLGEERPAFPRSGA